MILGCDLCFASQKLTSSTLGCSLSHALMLYATKEMIHVTPLALDNH